MSYRTFSLLTIANAAVIAAMFLAWTWSAWSHEAIPTAAKPQGWNYPFSCCSGYDCREVTLGPKGTVRETPQGYEIAGTGEIIAYGDKRIKDSPDGVAHWCSQGGRDTGGTICLFVPPRSF